MMKSGVRAMFEAPRLSAMDLVNPLPALRSVHDNERASRPRIVSEVRVGDNY